MIYLADALHRNLDQQTKYIPPSLPRTLHTRLIVLIEGAEFLSHMPEWINLSLIWEPIKEGLCSWSCKIFVSISGVVWRGFEPPITPGRYEPVSWKRFRIFETQPCEMRNSREILHGFTPFAAISIICNRIGVGNGRPLMKTPPSWFSLPWPNE